MNKSHKIINLEDKSIYSTGDAIRAAGLNWEVDEGPLTAKTYHVDPYSQQKVYGHCTINSQKAVFRTDNGEPLGSAIVGKDFHLLQNAEVFESFDKIIQETNAKFIAGGWFHNGASCFLQVQLPHVTPLDRGDQVRRNLIIATGHTGQQSVTMRFTNKRPSCMNTLIYCLRDTFHSYTLRHTKNAGERLNEAILHMRDGLKHLDLGEKRFRQMQDVKLSDKEILNYIKLAYDRPLQDHQDNVDKWRKWDEIEPVYLAPKGGRMSEGTLWHGYNIVTEFEDHHSRVIKPNGAPKAYVLTEADKKATREWRSIFGTKQTSTKVNAFRLADQVLDGKLDLRTGQKRTTPTRGGLKAFIPNILS
tara:strand:+ start:689 stop:1768 length:1080 start_codon:yes stop_codon:yes gene_type:complete